MATKSISWGKCSIMVRDIDNSGKWIKVATPKEDSTSLETTAGDELTADIEGGDYEDKKYGPAGYELSFTIRMNTERVKPLEDTNGVISSKIAVYVQPENANNPGLYIPYAAGTVEDAFDTTDGGTWTYKFSALANDTYTQKIFWCVLNKDLLDEAEGSEYETSSLTFTELSGTAISQITVSTES